jgi:hypothetical protein
MSHKMKENSKENEMIRTHSKHLSKHQLCYLWYHSLRDRYICIVAVQHRHSSKIDLPILSKSRNQFLQASTYFCSTIQSFWEQWRGASESIATYSSLQKNIPNAMDSVDVLTIWRWKHWMMQWMDRDGKVQRKLKYR